MNGFGAFLAISNPVGLHFQAAVRHSLIFMSNKIGTPRVTWCRYALLIASGEIYHKHIVTS